MPISNKDFDEGYVQPDFFSKVQSFINGKPAEAFTAAEVAAGAFINEGPSILILRASLDKFCERGHFRMKDVFVDGEMVRYYCSTQFAQHQGRSR